MRQGLWEAGEVASEAFERLVDRAISDPQFVAKLRSDPAGATLEYELSDDERNALLSGNPTELEALGVDQRVSKLLVVIA